MTDHLVTARAVAEQLGMSVAWVLDRFEAGELPGFKYGDSAAAPVRFRLSEVEGWLESRRRGPRLLDGQVREAGR